MYGVTTDMSIMLHIRVPQLEPRQSIDRNENQFRTLYKRMLCRETHVGNHFLN